MPSLFNVRKKQQPNAKYFGLNLTRSESIRPQQWFEISCHGYSAALSHTEVCPMKPNTMHVVLHFKRLNCKCTFWAPRYLWQRVKVQPTPLLLIAGWQFCSLWLVGWQTQNGNSKWLLLARIQAHTPKDKIIILKHQRELSLYFFFLQTAWDADTKEQKWKRKHTFQG